MPPISAALTNEARMLHKLRALPRLQASSFTLLEPSLPETLHAPLDFLRHPDQVEKIASVVLNCTDGSAPVIATAAALGGSLAEACAFVGVSFELVLARTLANNTRLRALLP